MKLKFGFLTALFVFSLSLSAIGQVFVPIPPTINMSNVIMNNQIVNQIRNNALGQRIISQGIIQNAEKNGTRGTKKPSFTKNYTFPKELSFKPSGYSVVAKKLSENQNGKGNSTNSQELENFFSSLWTNYLQSFREEHELGMPAADVGSALTFYIFNNYMTVNNLSSLEPEKTIAVYKQVSNVLLSNSDIKKMSNEDKEILAELFVTLGNIPNLIYSKTQNHQEAAKAARENLERMGGKNTDKLKITQNGIELK
ncbi:hypothetical protein BH18ACI1_BH18ACI1_10970 [soil metagenome]